MIRLKAMAGAEHQHFLHTIRQDLSCVQHRRYQWSSRGEQLCKQIPDNVSCANCFVVCLVHYNHILARRGAFNGTLAIYIQCRTCCPTMVTHGELACNFVEAFTAESVGELHVRNILKPPQCICNHRPADATWGQSRGPP